MPANAEFNEGTKMGNTDRLKKSLDDLGQKAENCSELAKDQRTSADKQRASSEKLHDDAHRLECLGKGLEKDVKEMKAELETAKSPPPSKGAR